jgi:hypothetical protein
MKLFIGRLLCWCGFHAIQYTGFDGVSIHAYCARCGKRGMIDSQGNLF